MADERAPGQEINPVSQSVDPQQLAAMIAQIQGKAPQSGDAAPQDQSAQMAQALQQISQQGAGAFEEQRKRAGALGDFSTSQIKAQAAEPLPKLGWLDRQGQPQQPGFLHNLARALTAVAASTVPGQAIQQQIYGPGIRAYQARQAQRAQTVEEAQRGQQTEASQESPAAGMVWHPYTAMIGQEKVDVARQRADTAALAVKNRNAIDLQRIAQGAQKLDIEKQGLAIKQWFDAGLLQAMNARIAAGQDENSARISAQEDMRAAASTNQWAIQHPVMQMLGISPPITAAPGAQQPKVVTPKSGAGTKPAYQKDGVWYDATTHRPIGK